MPELPEVEVTRRNIEPLLVGRTILRVATTKKSYFFLTDPAALRRGLCGRRVIALERVGKYLLAELDDARRVLLHLGMTGQLFSSAARSPRLLRKAGLDPALQASFAADRHTHLVLVFTDGGPSVLFRDARKFGKVRLLERGTTDPRLERLGPDALRATGPLLEKAARGRRIAVKSLLLDQSVLAGVGNIYADEALFLAGVRPGRRSSRVRRDEWQRIARALIRVLRRSIQTGGSSISDYVAPDGSDGRYQDERHVYARDGEPCRRCQAPIRRIVLGQRSAHFCGHCQT